MTNVLFDSIKNFVNDLSEVPEIKDDKQLKLYHRLLSQTKSTHISAVEKHISQFSDFVITNKDAVLKNDVSLIIQNKIVCSVKVFIDIRAILNRVDNETKKTIFSHLLYILAIVDPESGAKDLVVSNVSNVSIIPQTDSQLSTEVEELFTEIKTMIESSPQEELDPMKLMGSLMGNQKIQSLMARVKSGEVPLQTLIASMITQVDSILETVDDPQIKQMVGSVINLLKGGGDMTSMLPMIMSMMMSR